MISFINLQLHNHGRLVLIFKRLVKFDQLRMMQLLHHFDLVMHSLLVLGCWYVHELDRIKVAGGLFTASMDNTKCTAVVNEQIGCQI